MKKVVKQSVGQVIKKTLYISVLDSGFSQKQLLQVVEQQLVFFYRNNPTNPNYALLPKLQEVLAAKAFPGSKANENG